METIEQSGRYLPEHQAFRSTARRFMQTEVVPHFPEWEAAGKVPREVFRKIGDLGLLGIQIPEQYGGSGLSTFLYSVIWMEETQRAFVNIGGLAVHLNVVLPYFLSLADAEQKARWLPGIGRGETLLSIAMSEPGTGSDLAGIQTRAELDDDHYVVNGSKIFVTGGINADLALVVVRTRDEENRRHGLSLLVVDTTTPGLSRGRNLDKIGLKAQDTAELFFDNVRVPVVNRLGDEGAAFSYLSKNLPQERLAIAVASQAAAEAAIAETVDYVQQRKAFGATVSSFQNTKFELASCSVDVAAGRALLDDAVHRHELGTLTPVDAARVKIFCTELQGRVIDRCLQLHGGYGYMREYPVARLYADARVARIYGGTTEVLKTIIAKSMGL
jgi:acyl-CoA dehydrogenase